MAHSQPNEIENMGDAWRLTTAMGAFVISIVTDPRSEAQYPNWLAARQRLNAVLSRLPEDRLPLATEMLAKEYAPAERAETERFIREQLGLSDWANWLAPALLGAWECRQVDPKQFGIPVSMSKGTPTGRKPRKNGDDIKRNVEWFYRVHVKRPADSISEIAKEWAFGLTPGHPYIRQGFDALDNDARSVVQNGIKQARALLDVVGRTGLSGPKPPFLK